MNSAKVAGGFAPLPAHSIFPEPQSPVTQEKLVGEYSVQRVRAQIRPDQALGTDRVRDLPDLSAKPVGESGAVFAPESTPGHTSYRHLFTSLKEAEFTSEKKGRMRSVSTEAESNRRSIEEEEVCAAV